MEQALQWVRSALGKGFVVLDVETGGLNKLKHPVLTGGVVEFSPTGEVEVAREYLIQQQGGYAVPGRAPHRPSDLMRGDRAQTTKILSRQQMLEGISPWSREHILPQVEKLEATGAPVRTGRELLQEFMSSARGRIGVIQNTKFESSVLTYMGNPEEFQALGRTAKYASKNYQNLRMVPKHVDELIQGAYKSRKARDWWNVYRGLGDKAEGGLRHALETRGEKTMLLDLMDVTKSMIGGAKHGGIIEGFGSDVHTGTNVNVLNIARTGTVLGAESHGAAADAAIEGELLLKNLTIAEKMHSAQGRNLRYDAFFTTNESRYLQRLGNVQEWLKFKNMEKSFAEQRIAIQSGKGVSITHDVIDPFKTQVYRDGLEYTEMLSGIPGRTSTREMAERMMPGASHAERMVSERQIIFNRFASGLPDEALPRARQLMSKVWRLEEDALNTTANMQLKAEEILQHMGKARSSGLGAAGFSDDVMRIAGSAVDKFKGVYERHPTGVKVAALGVMGLMALGAARSIFKDGDRPAPTYPYSRMEGIRRKQSMYNQVRGVYASSMPMGNVSDFGSGFDYEKGAIRSAAAIYANTSPPMKNAQIEFANKRPYKRSAIVKPTEMCKPIVYPEPTPVPPQVPYELGSEDLPPISKSTIQPVTIPKQALQPPATTAVAALNNKRKMKEARTHFKMKIRETPAAEALGPYRNENGMGEVVRRSMTDFGSPSDPTRGLSRSVAENQLNLSWNENGMGEVVRRSMTDFGSPSDPTRGLSRELAEDQLKMSWNENGMGEVVRRSMTDFGSPSDPTRGLSRTVTEDQLKPRVKADPQQHWLIDRNVWDNEDTVMSHLEMSMSTASVRLDTGTAEQSRSVSAGKIFNKMMDGGISVGRSDIGLALKENDRGKLYTDHLEAVGSRLDVVPQKENTRDRGMRELHQGKAGILQSKPIQHKIDSQHLRLTGSAPIRRRHPVRSRAFRSCG